MSEIVSISCPVSAERINGQVVRVTAAFVVIITGIGLYYASPFVFLFLAIDFAFRAFGLAKYSVLKHASAIVIKTLQIKPTYTDAAPKKFAASLGLLFCLLLFVLTLASFKIAFVSVGALLVLCALLESLLNICLGCHVYTFINTLLKRKV